MPANTPRGYPYPLPTEPVAQGAQAIRLLAEAVEALAPVELVAVQKLTVAGWFDFQAIPARYDFLTCRLYVRSAAGQANDQITLRLNGDSGAGNYAGQQLQGAAASASAAAMAAASAGRAGLCAANTAPANVFSGTEIELFGVRSGAYKTWLGKSQNVYGAGQSVSMIGGHWNGGLAVPVPAVTRLQLFAEVGTNFLPGSIAALYGWRASP